MATTSNYIIYGLQDPDTYEIRYIGKSTKGIKRPQSHLLPCYYESKKMWDYPIYRWIRKLKSNNKIPNIIIIQQFNNILLEDLNLCEKYWIKYFKNNNLLNTTDGGDGSVGYKWTNEQKLKISKIHLGSKRTEEQKKNLQKGVIESRKHMDMEAFKVKVSNGTKDWWNNLPNKTKEKIYKNLNNSGKNKIAIEDQFGNRFQSLTLAAEFLQCNISSLSLSIKKNKPCKGHLFRKVA